MGEIVRLGRYIAVSITSESSLAEAKNVCRERADAILAMDDDSLPVRYLVADDGTCATWADTTVGAIKADLRTV